MAMPFLKWAGGKRWLIEQYSDVFPKRVNKYIEPFLGSGSVFFHLLPSKALLNDSNVELINTFKALQKEPAKIDEYLDLYQLLHSSHLYYKIRKAMSKDPIKRAAQFIYLNRTCFNGLYRVNKNGIFNVPMGSKQLIAFPYGFLEEISSALRGVTLRCCDFEIIINEAKRGDFIYLDPPYTVRHNNNNFVKYNSNLFSWDDQIRLSTAIREADNRGALIMLSNANHRSIKQLYKNFGTHYSLVRLSNLAGNSKFRGKTTELLITNYV